MNMKTLLAAEHVGDPGCIYYWALPAGTKVEIIGDHYASDYAIVENGNEIALVKVVGILDADPSVKYGHKKVLAMINSHEVKDGLLNNYADKLRNANKMRKIAECELTKRKRKLNIEKYLDRICFVIANSADCFLGLKCSECELADYCGDEKSLLNFMLTEVEYEK